MRKFSERIQLPELFDFGFPFFLPKHYLRDIIKKTCLSCSNRIYSYLSSETDNWLER